MSDKSYHNFSNNNHQNQNKNQNYQNKNQNYQNQNQSKIDGNFRKYPYFSINGYEVTQEVGCNREGGRITYIGKTVTSGTDVIIKEFRFVQKDSNWSGFKAYQHEIELLKQLNHPRIPRYLDSFETPEGFCLVQEYRNASSLEEKHSFTIEEIKKIAISVLEILVYLQELNPPIIHRDIKPENILVDEQCNAYLVDFGFARLQNEKVPLSGILVGTPGFMAPESICGYTLTQASDLYSLGVTLICLLSNTPSLEIGKLMDSNYRFDIEKLLPKITNKFARWLTKMVEQNVERRYPNAAKALQEINSINTVVRTEDKRILTRIINNKKRLIIFAVMAIGAIIASNITTFKYEKNRPLNQLYKTRECQACNLSFAYLASTNLNGTNLENANLENSNLENSQLKNANLKKINLKSSNLGSVNLEGANLQGANLALNNLVDANLQGANLEGASLENSNLVHANLEAANLMNSNLRNSNLWGTNLKDANLKGANLKNANLTGANLDGANLDGANLDGAIIAR
ncbi:pentapeptide repeat-containing protein [Mastigocoleus sp. MO_188.B34]|uniref:protein kinase domain-containing protein n=1 Tax=Mastigocoleus sp. MO_188.B34 TaxID=3036635 RepID=UPI002603A163|nr:pentapeptide repeat-containing protein [Mastigocoleus sp. MO_188.B34]MDJ0694686.1 pentapeptide repeat-containing protein [Mastigocoleus sp. MO_188.B34]